MDSEQTVPLAKLLASRLSTVSTASSATDACFGGGGGAGAGGGGAGGAAALVGTSAMPRSCRLSGRGGGSGVGSLAALRAGLVGAGDGDGPRAATSYWS